MENGKQLAFSSSFGRHEDDVKTGGLNKREYFAGLAMQGLLSDKSTRINGELVTAENVLELITKRAVDYADALLKELEK